MVKLLDYGDRTSELLDGRNPFGVVVAAHLASLATARRAPARLEARLGLFRALRRAGFVEPKAWSVLKFMDWVLELPAALEDSYFEAAQREGGDELMEYMTMYERRGLKRGREEARREARRDGLIEAIQLGLEIRFGADGLACTKEISAIEDASVLERVKEAVKSAGSLAEIRGVYAQ